MDDLKDKCSDEAIRKRIKQLIKKMGITQGQLGAIMEPSAHVNDEDVCKILSGAKVIPRNYARLARIARAGGVSLDWLLTGEETTAKSKEPRTLHDWCKILFVDMPSDFCTRWEFAGDDVMGRQFKGEPCEVIINIPIPYKPNPNYDTGGSFYELGRQFVRCALNINEINDSTALGYDNRKSSIEWNIKGVDDSSNWDAKWNPDIPF